MRQKSQTIIDRPASTRGINNEKFSVPLKNLWSFANGHAHSFPGFVGSRDEDPRTAKGQRIAHRSDVKILLAVTPSRPARPNEIESFPLSVSGAGRAGRDREDRPIHG